jgi:hypothetical protein
MDKHNIQVMKEKTVKGQYVRNLGTSSQEAKKSLQRSAQACLQKFYSHSKIGSSVLFYNPKLPQRATAAPSTPPKQRATTHGPMYAAAVSGIPRKWTPKLTLSKSALGASIQVAAEPKATAELAKQTAQASGLAKSSASSSPAKGHPSTPAAAASSSTCASSQTVPVQPSRPPGASSDNSDSSSETSDLAGKDIPAKAVEVSKAAPAASAAASASSSGTTAFSAAREVVPAVSKELAFSSSAIAKPSNQVATFKTSSAPWLQPPACKAFPPDHR